MRFLVLLREEHAFHSISISKTKGLRVSEKVGNFPEPSVEPMLYEAFCLTGIFCLKMILNNPRFP